MKRFVILSAAVLLLAIVLSPQPAAAQLVTARVNGGGTATFNGALDQVGIEGSQFGMQVDIYADGSAQGNFKCLMAGRSAFPGFLIMEVTGKVTAGVGDPALGWATFSGDAVLTTGNGNHYPTTFVVTVHAGGPGVGNLQLDGQSDGFVPPAWGFPLETVVSGGISVQ